MPKKRILFGGGILLLILIAAGWAYYLYNKPRQSAANETTNVTISADSLYSQYLGNEQACDKKYLGKVIEVTGKIAAIQHSGQSEIWILSTSAPNGGGINCQLFPGEKVENVKSGDQVTVKGKCTGFLMDVNLADCSVSR